MTADNIFQITNIIAAVGWMVILFLSPFWMQFDKFVIGIVVVILAIIYTWLNVSNFDPTILKKFGTLEGVGELFQNKNLLTAAWVHILAFDLLTATWIKNNAVKNDIGHIAIIPALIFTCMLGPLGFLIYLFTRLLKTRNYFIENFS